MSKRLGFIIFNFLGLEITWAACAYGAINSQPMFGVIVGLIYLSFHFLFTPSRRTDIVTMCCLASIGIAMDYINMRIGIVSFHQSASDFNFIPLWLVILWCVFSLIIPHSIYWLSKKPKLAIILGGILGSATYWLGDKLGAIFLGEPLTMSVSVYFIQWAIYMPVAYGIYRIIRNISDNRAIMQT